MKIDLFNVDEFVEINNLKEIKSGALMQRNNIKHPEGLLSDEIFGVTIKSRKETFAYIDLHGHFFHPHIYKAFKRLFRNVEKIVNGELYFSIDKNGQLIKDDNGETGIEFLYNNWNKIKWETKGGMRDERIDLLTKTPKNKVFMKYQIVIPVFYRDITGGSSSGGKTGDINNLYSRLIRYASMVEDKAIYDFQLHGCNYNIQNTIVDIYDYFKMKVEKKKGMIRQYLMGKRVDYCTREVITGPQYHGEKPNENLIDSQHAGVPLSSVCALANPFMMHYLKKFFDNMFNNESTIPLYNPKTNKVEESYELDHPETIYNEKFYKKMMNTYIRDPESRFNKFEIPVVDSSKKLYLYFSGVRLDPSNKSELSSITYRPLTWTDVLYMAAIEVTKDKHVLVTRYPLNDEFGIFVNKVRVTATTETMPAEINGKIYRFYPVIDIDTPANKIASKFVDSMQFSNSYLKGLGGDYDGDQITAKLIYTQEANKECDAYMKSKAFFIKANGANVRVIENEATQTFYSITKDPPANAGRVVGDLKNELINTPVEELTLNKLIGWISNTTNTVSGRSTTTNKPLMSVTDIVKLMPPEMGVTKPEETTVGRILFYRVIFESSGLNKHIPFINRCIEGGVGDIEKTITRLLINDDITSETMFKYIDCRDWLGLTLHGAVTASFTPNVVKPHPEVVKLKKELLKKYRAGLDAHDPKTSQIIEEALINKTKELIGDDPGMDLYKSKARGSLGNNYKNTYLFRGAVQRPYDGKYDIIETSLTEGLNKKDIGAHANTIVNGAYPKSCATAESGYIAKELMAALQTESLDVYGSDCGTQATIDYIITPKLQKEFEYRYIKEGSRLVCLTPDVIPKYIGKKVKLRTPKCCIGDKLCNKCAGDFFYKLGKEHAGLMSPIVATTCTNLNMKKFHENLVKVGEIDLDDIFV